MAPGWENTSTFSRKAISVGIDEIPAAAASCCWSSVSILPKTMSSCFWETSSYTGANILHGPHQSAHQSTSTMSLPSMVSWKVSFVRSTVAMLPAYWSQPTLPSSRPSVDREHPVWLGSFTAAVHRLAREYDTRVSTGPSPLPFTDRPCPRLHARARLPGSQRPPYSSAQSGELGRAF